jgi:uncharacterized protein (DUF736 family)
MTRLRRTGVVPLPALAGLTRCAEGLTQALSLQEIRPPSADRHHGLLEHPRCQAGVPPGLFEWRDRARDRLRLDRLGRNGRSRLSSPERWRAHSSPSNKVGPAPSSAIAAVLTDAAPIASGLSIAIEAAVGAARDQRSRRTTMATIGTFKKSGTEFLGEIVTLSVQTKNVRIVPEANRASDNAPSHRIYVGRAEIGAAWSKRSAEGRDYLSVKLDDPSFTAPIYANLFDDEDGDGFTLIWSRGRKANGE